MKRTALNRAVEEMREHLISNYIEVSIAGRYAKWGKIIIKIREGATKEECKRIFYRFIRENKIINEAKFKVESNRKQNKLI